MQTKMLAVKSFSAVILLCLAVAYASPVERDDLNERGDVEVIDPERDRGFAVISDVGGVDRRGDDGDEDYPTVFRFVPFSNPFSDFSFQDFRNRWRDWMNNFFSGPFGGGDDFDDFGNFPDFPPDYNNSTFTTQVINGSLVTVNETIKKHASNDSSFYFHVKVIKVKPQEGVTSESGARASETNTDESTTAATDTDESTTAATDTESTMADTSTERTGQAGNDGSLPREDDGTNDVNRARRFRRYAGGEQ